MEFGPIKIDQTQNTLIIKPGDDDGFLVCEENKSNEIYVYYSDVKPLIQILNIIEERNQHTQDTQQHIDSGKKNHNANIVNKPIEKNKGNKGGWLGVMFVCVGFAGVIF